MRKDRLLSIGIIALAIAWALPLAWVVLVSLKPNELLRQAGSRGLSLAPLTLENYVSLLRVSEVPRWLFNSFVVAIGMTAGTLATSALAGYALARLRFTGRKSLFVLFLCGMMIPEQVILIPLHEMFTDWNLHNTHFALIAPRIAGSFGVLLMTQFFRALPRDIEEAAELDGAGPLRIFFRIMLPQARPALTALGIFTFLFAWNDFLWPLVSATDSEMYTITLGLASMQGDFAQTEGLGFLMATAVFASLPMVLVYALFQRDIIRAVGGGYGERTPA
jgi:multiple sugar transport system permease protein